jgi:PAS domain S-box-containing protein
MSLQQDAGKTKEQLLLELATLRQRIVALEASSKRQQTPHYDGDRDYDDDRGDTPVEPYSDCNADAATNLSGDLLSDSPDLPDAITHATSRKQVEEALKSALQKLSFHVENSPLAVVEWDRNLRVIRWSKQAEAIFGWTAADVLGKSLDDWQFIHPDDVTQVYQTLEPLMKGREQRNTLDNRNLKKDGSIVYCRWYGSALFDEQGELESLLSLAMDLTDQHRAEDAIQAANRKTFSILETISEGFAAFDRDWRYTYLNSQGGRILGLDPEAVLGRCIWDLFPEAIDLFYEEFNRAMHEKVAVHFEDCYAPLNVWLDCHAYPLQDGGVCLYYQDISNRKRMEQALQIHRQRLDLVIRMSDLGVWFCDLPFEKLEWNDRCKAHYGLPPETEMTIDLFFERLHPDDRKGTRKAMLRAIEEHSTFDVTYRTIAPNGRMRWIRAIGAAYYNTLGTPVQFDGITVDVTAQKRQEEERDRLLHREQAARHLAELNTRRVLQLQELTAALAQSLTTSDVIEVLLNRGLTAFEAKRGWVTHYQPDTSMVEIVGALGYQDDEIAPYRVTPLTAPLPITDAIRTQQMIVVQSLQDYQERYPALAEQYGASGSQSVVAVPLLVEDRVIGSVGLSFTEPHEFGDADRAFMMTLARQCAQALERARLYEAERVARETAESANRVKDEFLAVLSHELRSPLNPILGWSRLLQLRKFNEATTDRALKTIERNAKLQTQLIEDLLDVSRILQGKLSLNICSIDLVTTIEAALETVRLAAETKSIDLQFTILDAEAQTRITMPIQSHAVDHTCSYGVGCTTQNSSFLVTGDPARLQQIVWNLVSNAVKFTPSGGRVEVQLEALKGYIQFRVIDTGKGIATDFIPYVFDYFRQADSSITRKFGGLGLGLAIVRHLVELHGGTVQVNSPGEEQGSVFTVTLPRLKNDHEQTPGGEALQASAFGPNLEGIKVLVVDDEADMREFSVFVLEQVGAETMVASSVEEALSMLLESQPDVLLSDIGMPHLDGYSLLRQLRKQPPEQGGQVPAIALTAYAGEYNQQRALAAGFQLHLSKPVEPEVLIAAISRLVHRS